MRDRAAKQALYDAFARIGKALSSGRRNEILDVLANGERSVESLAEEVGLSVANTSRHLQILRSAGLVSGRREGTFVRYRLADPEVLDFWRRLQDVAGRRLAEVERLARAYLGPDELEPVTKEELMRRLRAGEEIVVVDVRPSSEYEAGHIAGAVSIPLEELKRRLRELPRDREVVAYCRGRYCAFATSAVSELRRRGFDARRLKEGLPDWAAAGLPVEED
ncbi:MAG: ArsR/SmtB family transcription factor [Actinomycetota bacterium]